MLAAGETSHQGSFLYDYHHSPRPCKSKCLIFAVILASNKVSVCSNLNVSFGSDDVNCFYDRNISEQNPFSPLCGQARDSLVSAATLAEVGLQH